MAAPKKITPDLEREVLERTVHGHSAGAIAAWLLAEKGVKVSRQAVSNLLRQTRVERAEVTKAVVRETLTKTVTADIDILSETQNRLRRLETLFFERATGDGDPTAHDPIMDPVEAAEQMRKISDTLTKVTNTKMNFAGAGEPDSPIGANATLSVICVPPESED